MGDCLNCQFPTMYYDLHKKNEKYMISLQDIIMKVYEDDDNDIEIAKIAQDALKD